MTPSPRPAIPARRREPSRLLFPLGALLGVLSVLPFPLRTTGGGSLGVFHPVAQTLGFLTCFALGFVFTLAPRLTRTRGPDGWELLVGVCMPPVMVASAWIEASVVPYFLWIGIVGVGVHFTVVRLRAAPPEDLHDAALLWLPLSLAAGVIGAVLVAVAPLFAHDRVPPAWTIGRGLLSQGLSAGLVLGLAGAVARRWTGDAAAAPRAVPDAARRRGVAAHAAAIAVFFGSFVVEVLVDVRTGLALRAAVATGVLLAAALHRPRALRGLARRLAWLAAWLLPLGFWLAALVPRHRAAALHVVFVGGFAQLALAAAAHVTVEPDGARDARPAIPGALAAMAVLLGAAFAARLVAAWDTRHVASWLSVAAICFTVAVVAWAVALAPAFARRTRG